MPVAKKKKPAAKKATLKATPKKKVAKKAAPKKKMTAKKAAPKKKATTKKRVTKKAAPKRKTTARKATTRKTATTRGTTARKAAPKKKATKRKPNAAFMRPMTLSDALGAVVGTKAIPRTQVTKKLWAYIKKNDLQDSVNRRMINADEKLKKVFGGKKKVSMFEMTKLVSKHME